MDAEARSSLSVDEVCTNSQQSEESFGSGRARTCPRSLLCIIAFVLALSAVAILGYAYVSRIRPLRSRTVDLHWDMPDATAVLLVGSGGCQWREFPMARHSGNVYRCEVKPTSLDESKYFIRARVHKQLYESVVTPLGNSKRIDVAFKSSWALAPIFVRWEQIKVQIPPGHQVFVQWRDAGGFGLEDLRLSPGSDAFSSSHPFCAQHQWCPLVTSPSASEEIIIMPLTLHVPRHYQVQIRIKCAPSASPDVDDESTVSEWDKITLPPDGEGARILVTTERSAQGKVRGKVLRNQRLPEKEFVLHHGASQAKLISAVVYLGGKNNAWRRALMRQRDNSSGGTSATKDYWVETAIEAGESRFFIWGAATERGGRFFLFESEVRSIDTLPQFRLTFDADWELSCFKVRAPPADMEAGSMYYVQWRDSGGFGKDDGRVCNNPPQNLWEKVRDHSEAELTLEVPRRYAPEYRLGFQKVEKAESGMQATTPWRPVPIQVRGAEEPVIQAQMGGAEQAELTVTENLRASGAQ